jgi:hypothetical protein
MDSKGLVVMGVIAILLMSVGILPDFFDLGFNDDEPLDDDDVDDNGDDDGSGIDGPASSVEVETGYVDSEGDFIVPTDSDANSVFWPGTTDEVFDVFVNPILTIEHTDALQDINEIVYEVNLASIVVGVDGDYTELVYADFVTKTVDGVDVSVDGGSLGNVAIFQEIYLLDLGDGGNYLEPFLWNALDEAGIDVGAVFVDVGTYTVSIDIKVEVRAISIDYTVDVGGGVTNTGVYVSSEVFEKQIVIDLMFVVEPEGPPATITWDIPVYSPADNQILVNDPNSGALIEITYKPRTDGTPTTYKIYLNDVELASGVWDGGDVMFAHSLTLTNTPTIFIYKLVVATASGQSAAQSIQFGWMVQIGEPIITITISMSAFFSNVVEDSDIMGVVLLGAGFLLFVVVGYKYRTEGLSMISKKRKIKRRRKR